VLGRISLTVASRLALTVLSLVSSIVTARVLGQGGRGDYFFIITLSGTLVQLTNLGLPVSATYDVARDPATAPRVIANALWVSVVAAGGIGVILAIVAHAAGALQDTPIGYLLLAAALAPVAGVERVALELSVASARELMSCMQAALDAFGDAE